MSAPGRNCLLLLAAAALVVATSGQALSQAKRKTQPRPRRPARVSAAVQTSLSPTAALRAYYQAAINQDIGTAKKYFSAGTIRLLEEAAGKMGKPLDDWLRDDARRNTFAMPKFANERISGETAAVDVHAETTTFTVQMVKEGGEWKLAMDKTLEGVMPPEAIPPPPPAAEGDYTEDEKHRLFQAVGITQDPKLIIEVCQKLGLADSNGGPTPKMHAFIKAHSDWAQKDREFVTEHMTKEKALAYVMAHK